MSSREGGICVTDSYLALNLSPLAGLTSQVTQCLPWQLVLTAFKWFQQTWKNGSCSAPSTRSDSQSLQCRAVNAQLGSRTGSIHTLVNQSLPSIPSRPWLLSVVLPGRQGQPLWSAAWSHTHAPAGSPTPTSSLKEPR